MSPISEASGPLSPSLPRLVVVGADAVSGAAADAIARVLAQAIAARGVAHWATTGGSAAPGIYRALGALPLRKRVDWSRVHTWWGDDRFVPYDHPLSNVLALEEILVPLLEHAGATVPVEQLHRWPIPQAIALAEGPAWVAGQYAGAAAWDETATCRRVPAPTHIEPQVERVTFHPRLIPAARSVLVVTAGASKAANLGRAWTGDDLRELPVRAARLGTATWILDPAAAAELPPA